MTESPLVNEWISQGRVADRRQTLVEVLEGRFPGEVPSEVIKLIQQQESFQLLQDWFREAVRVSTFEDFMAVLRP